MGILSDATSTPDPRQEQPDVEQAHRRLEELRAMEQESETKRLNAQRPGGALRPFQGQMRSRGPLDVEGPAGVPLCLRDRLSKDVE